MKSEQITPFRRSSVRRSWSRGGLLLFLLAAASGSATAQHFTDTFDITTMEKTPAHPYYGVGHTIGYAINGVEGATMTIVRDSVYLVRILENPEKTRFQFYTLPIGGTSNFYEGDMDKYLSISQGLIQLRPTDEDPDTLYYASVDFPWVGGTILIVDSLQSGPTTSAPTHSLLVAGHSAIHPNPLVDHASLTFTLAEHSAVRWEIADAMGRIVFEGWSGTMQRGENRVPIDASSLPAGIYLYRVIAGDEETTRFTGRFRVLR